MTIKKIFQNWFKLKAKIHLTEIKNFPRERQIWWASLGQNVGVEINGKNDKFERPVLVIRKYNNEAVLILPISSKKKRNEYHFSFINNKGQDNIVILSQLRVISSKRFIRQAGEMNSVNFREIKNRARKFI